MSTNKKKNMIFVGIACALLGKVLLLNRPICAQEAPYNTVGHEHINTENAKDHNEPVTYVLVMNDMSDDVVHESTSSNVHQSATTQHYVATPADQAHNQILHEIEESEDTDDFSSIEQEMLDQKEEFFLIRYFKEFGVMLFLKYLDMQELYYEWRDYLMEKWSSFIYENAQTDDQDNNTAL